MRLLIRFQLERAASLPLDHQEHLAGLVYRLLGESDMEYARFLHDEGYRLEPEKTKRFKLFTFSGLRVPQSRRQTVGDRLRIAPGPVEWLLSSPVNDFLTHSATGLLTAGAEVCVGAHSFIVREVAALPEPEFSARMRFTCLSAIVTSRRQPDGGTYYLRPSDGEAFSEGVRNNLLQKHRLLHGTAPENALTLTFDAEYLARNPHGGQKKITVKDGIDVIGAFAPFTLTGSTELMRTGYECGFGEKNSMEFGMAEAR